MKNTLCNWHRIALIKHAPIDDCISRRSVLTKLEGNSHCQTHLLSDRMGPSRSSHLQTPNDYQRDLLWSFEPIFCLLRVLGIDLSVSQSQSKYRRIGFLTLAIVMWICNLTAISIQHLTRANLEAPNTTRFWVEILRKNCTTVSSILMPVTLLTIIICRWRPLWKKAYKMGYLVNLSSFLSQLRKVALATSAIVVFFIFLVNPSFVWRKTKFISWDWHIQI